VDAVFVFERGEDYVVLKIPGPNCLSFRDTIYTWWCQVLLQVYVTYCCLLGNTLL